MNKQKSRNLPSDNKKQDDLQNLNNRVLNIIENPVLTFETTDSESYWAVIRYYCDSESKYGLHL